MRLWNVHVNFWSHNIKFYVRLKIICLTRMHSSRMRTARSSSRLLGGLPQCILGYSPSGLGLETPLGVGLETPWLWDWTPLGVDLDPPGCGPGEPLGCGPGDPPARPLNLPPRCGPGDFHQPDPSTSPWVWAWRPPSQTPPPPRPRMWVWRPHSLWTEFLTHASENITLPQLRCGR